MEQLTGLGKTIIATDQDRIRLDRAVKNILAYKPLLARIFKETVEGTLVPATFNLNFLRDFSLNEIAE